jgi:hypothetical protein
MTKEISGYEDKCKLVTYSWSGAEIYKNFALFQKVIFLVQLDELEGGSGSIAFLLCQAVPFIKTAFSVLLLHTHLEICARSLSRTDGGGQYTVVFFLGPLKIRGYRMRHMKSGLWRVLWRTAYCQQPARGVQR